MPEAALDARRDHGRIVCRGNTSQYDSATSDIGPKGLPLTLILKSLTMTGFVQMTYRSKRSRGRGGSLAVIAHGKDETIMPGEVIGSGGNGCDLERGAWLNDGDCVELNVHGIGTLWNTVRAASP